MAQGRGGACRIESSGGYGYGARTALKKRLPAAFCNPPSGRSRKQGPEGKGAASSWVARQYRDEVVTRYAAVRNHQAGLGILGFIDGDNVGVQARLEELEAQKREGAERVAILIPTWSIETRVLWLSGETITESQSLKDQTPKSDFHNRLPSAIAAWRKERPDEAAKLPSLAAAPVELKRIGA